MKLLDEQRQDWDKFIVTGDLKFLSRVYFYYYDKLFDYGMRITSDKHAVEDAIQNEFMNLIRLRNNLGKIENLPGYLISSFRRQLFSDLKRQKTVISSEFLSDEHFEYFRESEFDSDKKSKEHLYRTIDTCISNLTGKQREILHLRFAKEIPYETISEMLNISVDSCYKSIYRSVNILRTEVEKVLGKKLNTFF